MLYGDTDSLFLLSNAADHEAMEVGRALLERLRARITLRTDVLRDGVRARVPAPAA